MKVIKIKKLFTESANLKWIAKRNNDRYKKYLSSLLYNKKYKSRNLWRTVAETQLKCDKNKKSCKR